MQSDNPQMNHDDALGTEGDYNDNQSAFSASRSGSQRPAVEPASGVGLAKILMIVFSLILVISIAWIAWRLMNGGSHEVDDTLSLQSSVATELPMTGAPIEEPVAVAAVSNPIEPAPAPTIIDAPPVPASNEATLAPIEKNVILPPIEQATVAPAATVQEGVNKLDAQQLAQLLSQIQTTNQRLDYVEQQIGRLKKQEALPRKELHQPSQQPQRRGVGLRSTAVTSEHLNANQLPAATGTTSGVSLKAVLEGRAWLQLKSGETVTVAPGDDVVGVGAVRTIDAVRGEVRFSNGLVLR